MKTIHVSNFGGGMASDIYAGLPGEFSTTRNFDILTYPNRLYPLPSMVTTTAGTVVQNITVASDLIVYGAGKESSGTGGSIWKTTGSGWSEMSNSFSGDVGGSNCLFDYPSNGSGKTIIYGGDDHRLTYVHPDGATSLTQSASFSGTPVVGSLSNGYVHPTDDIAYVGYTNATATYIARKNGSIAMEDAVLTLPLRYRVVSITKYQDYLAIGCTSYSIGLVPSGSPQTSVVFLWDRSATTWNYEIQWGDNSLFALNNVNGTLVGISTYQENDYGSVLVRGYAGGEAETLQEILITRQDPANSPTFNVYPRVNFVHRGRMFFSCDLVGGGTSPSHKGLWSVGKNKQGRWVCTVERFASTDGSDVSVISAAFRLGYLFANHTAAGTLTVGSTSTDGWDIEYQDPSIYESVVNPEMPDGDKILEKNLKAVAVHYLPLPATGQVVLQYRVDSAGSWTTIFTETTDGATETEAVRTATTVQFLPGRNYEFRLESTGNAQITGFTYTYDFLKSDLT